MMNIKDFPVDYQEQRGQLVVRHTRLRRLGASVEVWRFLLPVVSKLGPDVWVQMLYPEIVDKGDDESILYSATHRLVSLTLSDAQCALRDGRLLSGMDPEFLYKDPS